MASYRAKAQLYVGTRLVAVGEKFTSDLTPGLQWEPLDEEAHDRFQSYVSHRAKQGIKVQPAKAPAAEKPIDSNVVAIPDGWRDLRPEKRINLARRLGAPVKGTNEAKANEVIEAELAKRQAAANEGENAGG